MQEIIETVAEEIVNPPQPNLPLEPGNPLNPVQQDEFESEYLAAMGSFTLGIPSTIFGGTAQGNQFNSLAQQFQASALVGTFSSTFNLAKTVTSPTSVTYTNLNAGFVYDLLLFLYNGIPTTQFITNAILANPAVVDYIV